ncbi:sun-family protein, putative [Theileria annulata]|uniref:Sun-family protein, putative n=1 Tax=Theileria annulata TaxID=5874 RepID=Q4UDQ5_THEAN|nr:sun-family protein, putative [Theileria annulata]CAI74784.1 sun-family protein, putative [Theileria annulata]|eukprot:XP_952516.1 sun-family protein, putative [Theileria annulata]
MLGINSTRARHLENSLSQYFRINSSGLGISSFLKFYFMANRVSTGNRAWVSQHFREVMRWKLLIEHTSPKPLTWTSILNTYLLSDRWRLMTNNKSLPPHVRCSFPQELFELIDEEYGLEKAIKICNILNEEPVTFLRVNTLKLSRDKAYKFLLHKGVPVEKCVFSNCGLFVQDKRKLLESPEYKSGIVEIQDESSQIIGQNINCSEGDHVLDFCCGSGGKSLVFGPKLGNRGRIYLHDVNDNLLQKAKKRMHRAGIRNYYILDRNLENIETFYGKMDYVIVDVPCSGIGACRTNPDRKWSFKRENLNGLLMNQRLIVEESLPFLKKNGKLVYITCSIFKAENQSQVDFFSKKYNLRPEEQILQLPESRGMNGYYMATLVNSVN